MENQKYYAVKKGKETGIFTDWNTCYEKAINGFSGVDYKSFESEEEAKAYLNDEDIVFTQQILPRLTKGEVVAFTDGSFDEKVKAYGSGACIFAPNNISVKLSNRGNNDKYIELRNVAGEIIAVFAAVDWAWKNGYNTITVFHDYEGISKWANGEWKTNKTLTQYYKKYIDDKKDVITINFIKVSGHSNNKYNDIADHLAKGAIFESKIISDKGYNSGYIISPVNEDNIIDLLEKIKDETSDFRYLVTEMDKKKIWSIQFQNEKLSIILFNDVKMMVQGKRSNLFQIITAGIVENLIKNVDFIKVLRDAYGISIDKAQVDDSFRTELPTLSNINLPDNISLLLKQAVINLSNPAYNDAEFTMYTFPSLKALEGILKFNLVKCNIPMNSSSFTMFDKLNGIYVLQEGHKANLTSDNITKLENCYNHLHNNRHTLFHFGIVIGDMDTNTRTLKTKVEANKIIKDTLDVVDKNYIV